MAELSTRERQKLYVNSVFVWMEEAYSGTPGKVNDMIHASHKAFKEIIESYEEELECLRSAQHVDKDTQTTS